MLIKKKLSLLHNLKISNIDTCMSDFICYELPTTDENFYFFKCSVLMVLLNS
jgi:hypothetical protein